MPVSGQTIAQRRAAGKTSAPLHDGGFIWSRFADSKEWVGTFDQLQVLIEQLIRADAVANAATLPLALTDDLYVIQAGGLATCNVQDILNINLATVLFTGSALTGTIAHTRNVIIETTNNAFNPVLTLPKDTGNPAVDIPLNGTIEVVQVGTGQAQFALQDPPNMAVLAPEGMKARVQGSTIFARRRGANAWHVTGDTTT